MTIRPQPGFQMDYLSSPADIVIGGGAAGAGKTYALILEPLRNMAVPGFGGVIFRRTYPQIKNEGGLWDTCSGLYPNIGMKANESTLEWTWPSNGNKIKFSHLQYEKNIYDFQGSQIPFIGFDELTHFTEKQFFYLLSRNRSVCGVKPYVRATCNPDPDSWVRRFLDWWIDKDTGMPIPERCGKLRYFTRDKGSIVWGDTATEVIDMCPHIFDNADFDGMDKTDFIKSVTFIPGTIYGNKELLKVNPSYLGDLLAQDEQTKSQLLEGNWNVKVDGACLYDNGAILDIFTNHHARRGKKYITVDAARFGSDLCVIWVWDGNVIIDMAVYEKSATTEIAAKVREFEAKYSIGRSNTVCDADGIGGGVIDLLPGMHSFNNNASPIKIKTKDGLKPPEYDNLKTQCYYHSAARVNNREIYMEEHVAGMWVGNCMVRDVLAKQLRAIKRDKVDADGKQKIIPKAQMKNILGCSPDHADAFMMREYFELKPSVSRMSSQVV